MKNWKKRKETKRLNERRKKDSKGFNVRKICFAKWSRTKEKERTTTKPGTKPDEDSPYKPKPGTKKKPKARKGDMPDWLSFDELGIDFE